MAMYTPSGLAIFDSFFDPPLDNRPKLSSTRSVCRPLHTSLLVRSLIHITILSTGIRLRASSALLREVHLTRFRRS
jgi:hypothetical protein